MNSFTSHSLPAEILCVMLEQEEEICYTNKDYMTILDEEESKYGSDQVDENCRRKMVRWCYNVVDFLKLQRCTVSVAVSFLDRYLSNVDESKKEQIFRSRKQYQLISMTSLYMAIKFNECSIMNMKMFVAMSQGCYSESEMSETEVDILSVLKWRLCGPTAVNFVEEIFNILQTTNIKNVSAVASMKTLSNYQLELASGEICFISQLPSITAIAAVLNSIQLTSRQHLSDAERYHFFDLISEKLVSNLNSTEITSSRMLLADCLKKSSTMDPVKKSFSELPTNVRRKETTKSNQGAGILSPVCVITS